MKLSKLLILAIVLTACCAIGIVLSSSAEDAAGVPRQEPNLSGKININIATSDQLELLPRIGKKTAQSIVEYRTQNGPFKKVDDLTKVRGIGEKTLDELKKYLAVEGATTLKVLQ